MSLLYAVTLFVAAFLLFWVEPLIAKMLLPMMGGTPTVWNTCVLFFQAMLLAGYAYALALTRWLDARGQMLVHAGLLAAAALALPFAISEATLRDVPVANGNPVVWLLWRLLLTTGLPFFVVAASAPLLQKWFSQTGGNLARDPYFLYAASNAGSLCALVFFPLLLEPHLTLRRQGVVWMWTYAALAVLFLVCAFVLWRACASRLRADSDERDALAGNEARDAQDANNDASDAPEADVARDTHEELLTTRRRARWTLLAFVPSSLVLGVTTYITTDVTAVPLLWIIPLALYLLTFVLAFARRRVLTLSLASRVLPGAAVILTLVYLSSAAQPAWFIVLLHLLFFFIASFVCHAQLSDERPDARHLAEFYLWIALGGALGGVFNAIIAPLVFKTVVEYPLVIVLACLLRPRPEARGGVVGAGKGLFGLLTLRTSAVEQPLEQQSLTDEERRRERQLDYLLPLGIGVLTIALALIFTPLALQTIEKVAAIIGLPLFLLNHFFTGRRVRFALGLAAIMLGSLAYTESGWRTLHAERNFYGTLRVSINPSGTLHTLRYGSTLHGRQLLDPARGCEPLSYYHREGPLGSIFKTFNFQHATAATTATTTSPEVAVVGLGTGASVTYSTPDEHWTFYEINPAVVRLARDPAYFTYLQDCAAAPVNIVLGDARLNLRDARDGQYGLIILDAFSSDSIPAHLLTREALALYLSKLAPGGLIAFHLSNRTLDLNLVANGLARDAHVHALAFDDLNYEPTSEKDPSRWVVVARDADALVPFNADAHWHPLDERGKKSVVWTDDFSNIISVFRWL